MWQMILPMLQNQPKFRSIIEHTFNQPVEHVLNCFGAFFDNVSKGPGIKNTTQEKQRLFDRYYQGGLSMGFEDWQSYIAAAKLAGYTDLDVCYSFRKERNWNVTTEKIQELSEQFMPDFIEKGKNSGLFPPEMFPDTEIPKTNVSVAGSNPPWEKAENCNGAYSTSHNNNAPK